MLLKSDRNDLNPEVPEREIVRTGCCFALGLAELTSDVSKTAEAFFACHGFHAVEQEPPIRWG